MRNCKKIFCLLIAVLVMLVLSGCREVPPPATTGTTGGSPDPSVSTTHSVYPGEMNIDLTAAWTTADVPNAACAAFSDVGYYYMENGRLHFMDTASGISVVLCQKVGCAHQQDDKDCEARLSGTRMMFYSDGHIYYDNLVREEPNSIYVFRRNADGTGEEKVAVLGEDYISPNVSLYIGEYIATQDALYFTVYTMEAQKQETGSVQLLERDGILLRLELTTGKQQEILRKRDTLIRLIGAREDALLFYTLDKLPDEMFLEPDWEEKMKDKPASIQVWGKELGTSWVLREETYSEFTEILGLRDGRIYYRDYDGACFTYEVSADAVSDTKLNGHITIVNDRYILNGKTDYSAKIYPQLLDCETGAVVSGAYENASLRIRNKSETGCMIEIIYYGDVTSQGTVPILRQIQAYVTFAALEDGLQGSDLLIIRDVEG